MNQNINQRASAERHLAFRRSVAALCCAVIGTTASAGPVWPQAPAPFEPPVAAETASNQPRVSSQTQGAVAKFERLAITLEFFALRPFLYNRARLIFTPADPESSTRYFQVLAQVFELDLPLAEIVPLRHHTDPKVRTLVLAALFQRNDAHLLPLIVELASDTAPTFPGHPPLSTAWLATTGIGPPPEKQTVGDVASAMVNFYLKSAGFHYGVDGSSGRGEFADYWAQRQARTFCASWFAVELARASRGTGPTQPEFQADIRALRKRIEALPAADRDWTLLYLNGEEGSDVLASEAELIAAAQRRGPDALRAVLRERIPSDDPDVQRRQSNDWPYKRLMLWILERAPQLLRREMADDLLACEIWQRDYRKRNSTNPVISAAWPVAAARLQPQRGREILQAAWLRFDGKHEGDDRVMLMSALTVIGDARDYDFIASWFFAPPPDHYDGTSSGGRQAGLLGRMPRPGASAATREMVARLIHDKRFDSAKFQAVRQAAELANAWSDMPIFNIQKLYEAGWIGGEQRPAAQAAITAARETLRETSSMWRPYRGD